MADLAPRDVVSAAIVARMRATGTDHVFLDARGFGEQRWEHRFPTILAACRMNGIDPVTQLIPVAPACALRVRWGRDRHRRAVLHPRPLCLW